MGKKTYLDKRFIYSNNIGGIVCSHCDYVSPEYEEKCINCGRRLTEV